MPRWDATLDIKESWQEAKEKKIGLGELCQIISKRLGLLRSGSKWHGVTRSELTDWVSRFAEMSTDPDLSVEDFDNVWAEFYAWCDQPSVRLWVRTII